MGTPNIYLGKIIPYAPSFMLVVYQNQAHVSFVTKAASINREIRWVTVYWFKKGLLKVFSVLPKSVHVFFLIRAIHVIAFIWFNSFDFVLFLDPEPDTDFERKSDHELSSKKVSLKIYLEKSSILWVLLDNCSSCDAIWPWNSITGRILCNSSPSQMFQTTEAVGKLKSDAMTGKSCVHWLRVPLGTNVNCHVLLNSFQ